MPFTTLVPSTTITSAWANANVRDQVITPFGSVSARDSAITAPVNGQYCTTTDTGGLWRYNGTKWLREPTTIYKNVNTTYTNQATLQTDPELQFPGDANAVYEFDFVIGFLAASTPKYSWAPIYPAAAVGNFTRVGLDAAGAAFNDFAASVAPGGLVTVSTGVGAATTGSLLVFGTVFFGANPGTFAWQACQQTSGATTVQTLKGSKLRYRQIG